ncbi:hypothetical protein Plhal703r1_c42g0141751 [Plasmopara halstedii]
MPQAMEIDGSGEVDHSKPVAPSNNDYGSTNIDTLSKRSALVILPRSKKR